MDDLEIDPFVDKNQLPLNDGKIDYSQIIQVKNKHEISTTGNADTQSILVCILPSIYNTYNKYEVTAATGNNNPIAGIHTKVIDQPVFNATPQAADTNRLNNGKGTYWRLLSYGVKVINKNSESLTSGYVEHFEEPCSSDYIIRTDNVGQVSFIQGTLERYTNPANASYVLSSPHYAMYSWPEIEEDNQFVGTKIDNHHNFIHLPQHLASHGLYRHNDPHNRSIHLSDKELFSERYFDMNFRKKFLLFHLPPDLNIELLLVHNYEFFSIDVANSDNLYLENRGQHANALGSQAVDTGGVATISPGPSNQTLRPAGKMDPRTIPFKNLGKKPSKSQYTRSKTNKHVVQMEDDTADVISKTLQDAGVSKDDADEISNEQMQHLAPVQATGNIISAIDHKIDQAEEELRRGYKEMRDSLANMDNNTSKRPPSSSVDFHRYNHKISKPGTRL
jgi:hypothetical protein